MTMPAKKSARGKRSAGLVPLSDVQLTSDEEAELDDAFVRDAVNNAVASVTHLLEARAARVSQFLAMRDVVFAQWLRNHIECATSAEVDCHEDVPALVTTRKAIGYQRVTRFAVARNLNVAEYLRFVDVLDAASEPISEQTPDEHLNKLLRLVRGSSSRYSTTGS